MIIRGIALLVLALLVFAVQDAIVKSLTRHYTVIQILTLRILLVVLMLGLIARIKIGWRFLIARQWPLMVLRGFLAFSAFTHYYFALSYLPLADAATVFMTAPLFVTALSFLILGELVGIRRWLAVVVGFTAVVFMLNPGSDVFRMISVLPLASALFYSCIPIVTRKFSASEHTLTITFYTASAYALFCIVASVMVYLWPASPQDQGVWALVAQPWKSLTSHAWLLVFLSSAMFSMGILCITAAYRAAEVSVLAPFEYSYLIWATLIGYLMFSDVPELRTWLAGFVIAGSGIYIAFRERSVKQQ